MILRFKPHTQIDANEFTIIEHDLPGWNWNVKLGEWELDIKMGNEEDVDSTKEFAEELCERFDIKGKFEID